ncbi:hypothetical protein FHG87_004249 [Trinorchestia longiramus]|nr:hypothetical protein FHG87_004249 [Trinorchestia longiramus]
MFIETADDGQHGHRWDFGIDGMGLRCSSCINIIFNNVIFNNSIIFKNNNIIFKNNNIIFNNDSIIFNNRECCVVHNNTAVQDVHVCQHNNTAVQDVHVCQHNNTAVQDVHVCQHNNTAVQDVHVYQHNNTAVQDVHTPLFAWLGVFGWALIRSEGRPSSGIWDTNLHHPLFYTSSSCCRCCY